MSHTLIKEKEKTQKLKIFIFLLFEGKKSWNLKYKFKYGFSLALCKYIYIYIYIYIYWCQEKKVFCDLNHLCTFHKVKIIGLLSCLCKALPDTSSHHLTRSVKKSLAKIPTYQCRTESFKSSFFQGTIVE